MAALKYKETETCWGCEYNFGPVDDPKKFPALFKLWQFFTTNIKKMDILSLSKQLHAMHYNTIYVPSKKYNIPTMIWDTEMIHIHIKRHMNYGALILHHQIKDTRLVCDTLKDMIFKKNKVTDQFEMDQKNIKEWRETSKYMIALCKTKPEQLINPEASLF